MNTKIRNWCLGTILGSLMIGVCGNLCYDSLSYGISILRGIPTPKVELLAPDGRSLRNANVTSTRIYDSPEFGNWCITMPLGFKNTGTKSVLKPFLHIYTKDPLVTDQLRQATDEPDFRWLYVLSTDRNYIPALPRGGSTPNYPVALWLAKGHMPISGSFPIKLKLIDGEEILWEGQFTLDVQPQ